MRDDGGGFGSPLAMPGCSLNSDAEADADSSEGVKPAKDTGPEAEGIPSSRSGYTGYPNLGRKWQL